MENDAEFWTAMRNLRHPLTGRSSNPSGSQPSRAADSWWLDVKLGARILIKRPGLTLVGGVGIAVAVAIAAGGFSVTYDTYLSPTLPFEEGDRIVSIEVWDSAARTTTRNILHDFQVWREELKSVQEISAFRTVTPNLIAPGAQPGTVKVASMSASGFGVARVRPLMGRYLVEDDERPGAPAAVVIGESVWRNRFAADPAILGRTIQFWSTPHSIVGVMPESFAFPVNHHFWIALRTGATTPEPQTGPDIMVFGRLAPGETLESARAELVAAGRRAAVAFPKIYSQLAPLVLPYPHPFMGLHGNTDTAGLHLMQGIVASLLVVVCLNVAILVYSRTAMRQAEISIRTALGASRSRIVAQLFIESFVLSALATLAGIGIAAFGLHLLAGATRQIATELPFWVSFHLSTGSVLYAGALSVLAAAIVGILPALKATKREVQTGLRVIGSGGSGMRLGKTWTMLIVGQVGCAVALLPAAIVNGWGSMRAGIADTGFAAEEFLSAKIGMDSAGAGEAEFTRRYASRQTELMRRLEADPRISSTTFSMAYPGDEPGARIETQAAAQPGGSGRLDHEVRFNRVDVNFFRAFNVPILAGRGFQAADAGGSEGRVVVVNRTFAERVFGGDALGRRIRYSGKGGSAAAQYAEFGRWYEIVGVVADFPSGARPDLDEFTLQLYHPVAAGQVQPATVALRVRGGAPTTFSGRLREIAAAVDPDLQLREIVSLDEALRREQWIRRLEASVLGAVTLSVLLLSSAGIYALMSLTVSQRRKEIGIRTALGADRTRIVASIFSRALGQLAVGAVLGAALGAAFQKASGGSLLQDEALAVLTLVALFMIAVGLLAAIGPARRCLRIEPTEALREQ
jgi:predicted permease